MFQPSAVGYITDFSIHHYFYPFKNVVTVALSSTEIMVTWEDIPLINHTADSTKFKTLNLHFTNHTHIDLTY